MESISRISTFLESARELTLDAATAARNSRGSTKTMPTAQVKKLLDSRNEREVLEGLKRAVSMMYRSQPTLPLFPSIIKNIASPSLPIRKLVYILLLHHAEADPDLALLSINTIQKSLSDSNPQVRALALKTMSGIRVPVISQIVSLAIKKGLADMSPLVRKAAALAIPKCYALDPSTLPQLLDYLETLLGDKQYYVAGAAVKAFSEICPDRIDLIHKHYRSLVRKLVDMDEWSQLITLKLMTNYARRCFPRGTRKLTRKKATTSTKGFYDDDIPGEEEEEETGEEVQILDPDLDLLLSSIKPLLQSRNSGVVVAVTRCYISLGTPAYIALSIGPLIALLRGPQDIQQIALYNIVSVCLTQPKAFAKYASHFLIHTMDTPQIWELKLEVLTLIFPHADAYVKSLILNELEHFSRGSNKELVREAVRAIGRCAQSDSKTSARCLRLLLNQITSLDGNLVAESLTVIRHLIQQDPDSHHNTVTRLAKNLDTATNPQARASIIWLVGEFAGVDGENNIAADVLRILAKGFADEAEPAKLQIVLLAAKVYLHHLNRTDQSSTAPQSDTSNSSHEYSSAMKSEGFAEEDQSSFTPTPKVEHTIAVLWQYILLLARYDTSYDLRDRARVYRALLAVPSSTQLASLVLLAPKPVPHTPSPSEGRTEFTLGSSSLVVGGDAGIFGLRKYEKLPDWVEAGKEPDPRLRDAEPSKPEYGESRTVPAGERLDNAIKDGAVRSPTPLGTNGLGSNVPAKEKTLDDWLAEDNTKAAVQSNEVESSEEESSEEQDAEETDDDDDESEEETDEEDGSTDDDDTDQEQNALVK